MAGYQWDPAKNAWLIKHRGISFDDIVWHMAQGDLLDVLVCDRERYRGQQQFVVNVNDYAYLVPFIERGGVMVLKTVIPCRKLIERYLRKERRVT